MPSRAAPTPEPDPPKEADDRAWLRELVAECIDRFADEGRAAIEAVCAANPPLASAIRARLAKLDEMGLLEPARDGEASFPERLGEFRLLRRLGGGGMGVVYLAEQTSLGRKVALKVVRPGEQYFGHARERFRREAQLIAALRHPGIVPVHAFGEEGDVPFYAMELVDGASLDRLLDLLHEKQPASLRGADLSRALDDAIARGGDGAKPATTATRAPFAGLDWIPLCLGLVKQAAEALAHAHASGVIHRDVKPSNLMLARDGRVLLVDFGLSTSSRASKLTKSGAELGSLPYMPPELLRSGMASVDARSDVYSLGVTLYELLTLRSPFAAREAEATRRAILAGTPRRPRELNPAISRDVETVCLTAMDVDPARRYACADAFARDLDNALALRPIAVKPATPWLRARRWSQRHPARALALAVAAVLVIGGPIAYGVVQRAAAEKEREFNESLSKANTSLEKKQQELEAALESEKRERGRAETNVSRARRAVEEMLADVAAEELHGVPQAEEVRQRMLEKSLGFYREMMAEAPGDAGLELERALAARAVADLMVELGRFDEAEPIYVEQVATLRRLAAAAPAEVEPRASLASCLSQLASIQNGRGDGDLAEQGWNEAIGILEQIDREAGGRGDSSINLVILLENVGYAAYARGDSAESLRRFERAIAAATRLLEREPTSIGAALVLGRSHDGASTALSHLSRPQDALRHSREGWKTLDAALARAPRDRRVRIAFAQLSSNLGVALLTGSDTEETERVLKRGFDEALALHRDFPRDPELGKKAAVLGCNYGSHLSNSGDSAAAVPVFEQALTVLDRLELDFPERTDFPYYLGSVLTQFAALHMALGDVDAAEPVSERALVTMRKVAARSRGDTGQRTALASALFVRADVLRARGDLESALALIREALALGPARADVLYQAVEIVGACSLTADEQDDEPMVQAFVELALQTLRAAVKNGFRDAARLSSVPELALVRDREEFHQVLDDIARASQ